MTAAIYKSSFTQLHFTIKQANKNTLNYNTPTKHQRQIIAHTSFPVLKPKRYRLYRRRGSSMHRRWRTRSLTRVMKWIVATSLNARTALTEPCCPIPTLARYNRVNAFHDRHLSDAWKYLISLPFSHIAECKPKSTCLHCRLVGLLDHTTRISDVKLYLHFNTNWMYFEYSSLFTENGRNLQIIQLYQNKQHA